ncbi:uncharacterized protein LOC119839119 [Zerene cesonia]|uniref:uncharacterized protein LOC119839119 n=1 Tax=Zerene cesonia TaxID=33412 RepID=UPI0018E50C6A|nr:uncharacterized protein LOC119839119 [Zerene cesonia]
MAESLFDIFGDTVTRQAIKNVVRQPLSNIENMGKTMSAGPYKPNEPLKPTKKNMEKKKSFLSNIGKALNNTPMRQCSPGAINVGSLIYNDDSKKEKGYSFEELEFTKPSYRYDNFHADLFDYLPVTELQVAKDISPPNTPPPAIRRYSLELDCSYQDEFYTDEFSIDSIPEMELNLPDIF